MGHLPSHICTAAALLAGKEVIFLRPWENYKSSTFLSTLHIYQNWMPGRDGWVTSLKFDSHVCWLWRSKSPMTAKTITGPRVWCVRHSDRIVPVRRVRQGGFLADDAWSWKWPGGSPGSTYGELLSGHFSSAVKIIRWLPPRLCEKGETCCVQCFACKRLMMRCLIHNKILRTYYKLSSPCFRTSVQEIPTDMMLWSQMREALRGPTACKLNCSVTFP